MGKLMDDLQKILRQPPEIHPDSRLKDKYVEEPTPAPQQPKSELAKLVGYMSFGITAIVLSVAMLWTSCQENPRKVLENAVSEIRPEPEIRYVEKRVEVPVERIVYRDRVQKVPVYKDRTIVRYRTLEELEPGCFPDWEMQRTYAVAPRGKVLLCYVDYQKRTIRSRIYDQNAPVLNSLR